VTNQLEVYDKCHHFGRAQRSIAAAQSASASQQHIEWRRFEAF
jgi:hypothetical protein